MQGGESYPVKVRRSREGRGDAHADVHRESHGRSDDPRLSEMQQTVAFSSPPTPFYFIPFQNYQGRWLQQDGVLVRRLHVLRVSEVAISEKSL